MDKPSEHLCRQAREGGGKRERERQDRVKKKRIRTR